LTSTADRSKALEILEAAVAAGARGAAVARLLGVGLTKLQRWRQQYASNVDGVDRRKGSHRHVAHRHSGIKFMTPHQRHDGDAAEICRHRAIVNEQARQRNPRRLSRSTRCWHQPELL
jgi:hypothetical protein